MNPPFQGRSMSWSSLTIPDLVVNESQEIDGRHIICYTYHKCKKWVVDVYDYTYQTSTFSSHQNLCCVYLRISKTPKYHITPNQSNQATKNLAKHGPFATPELSHRFPKNRPHFSSQSHVFSKNHPFLGIHAFVFGDVYIAWFTPKKWVMQVSPLWKLMEPLEVQDQTKNGL